MPPSSEGWKAPERSTVSTDEPKFTAVTKMSADVLI
jgi:hypothetical protein